MKKLSLAAVLLFSTVFVVGSTCLIGSDSKKSTETMTLAVEGMACEEAWASKIETALIKQKGVKNADVCFDSKTAPKRRRKGTQCLYNRVFNVLFGCKAESAAQRGQKQCCCCFLFSRVFRTMPPTVWVLARQVLRWAPVRLGKKKNR